MTDRKVRYAHTIDGLPAEYLPGGQISYLDNRVLRRFAASLEQIRREQKASAAYRIKRGFTLAMDLGYFRVRLP